MEKAKKDALEVRHTILKGPHIICERCNRKDLMPDDVLNIHYYLARIALFNQYHAKCKPKDEEEIQT